MKVFENIPAHLTQKFAKTKHILLSINAKTDANESGLFCCLNFVSNKIHPQQMQPPTVFFRKQIKWLRVAVMLSENRSHGVEKKELEILQKIYTRLKQIWEFYL